MIRRWKDTDLLLSLLGRKGMVEASDKGAIAEIGTEGEDIEEGKLKDNIVLLLQVLHHLHLHQVPLDRLPQTLGHLSLRKETKNPKNDEN